MKGQTKLPSKPPSAESFGHEYNHSGQDPKEKKFSVSKSFKDIRYTDHFVDKSLLIKCVFETLDSTETPIMIITAPPKFGKSVNMSMIKFFLEKQVEKATGLEILINDETSNMKLFEGLKIMEPEHEQFVASHFGRFPVIEANFMYMQPISTMRDAFNVCKHIIHKAYKQHEYLIESKLLNDNEKILCQTWCNGMAYLSLYDELVPEALSVLADYLHKHFKKKVYVLIDEYDSMYLRSMADIEEPEDMLQVIWTSIGMIVDLVKSSDCVAGTFLTGISQIVSLGISSVLGKLPSCPFLGDHKLVKFYGLTSNEVEDLFDKFGIKEHERKIAREKYNGYKSKDGELCIYNTWSIVHFLQLRIVANYWAVGSSIAGLLFALDNTTIQEKIEDALLSYNGVIDVAIIDHLVKDHFLPFHSLVYGNEEETSDYVPTVELFFTSFLELGYLSYGAGDTKLKLPNEEIEQKLHKIFSKEFQAVYGIQESDSDSCTSAFNKIFYSIRSKDKHLKNHLDDLKTKLEVFIKPLSESSENVQYLLQRALFGPLYEAGYKYCTEINTKEKEKSNYLLYKDDCVILIELKYIQEDTSDNTDSATEILKQKYYSLLENELCFTSKAKTFLLVNLCFNAELKVALPVLRFDKLLYAWASEATLAKSTEEYVGKYTIFVMNDRRCQITSVPTTSSLK